MIPAPENAEESAVAATVEKPLPVNRRGNGIVVERPGFIAGSWEQWLIVPGIEAELLPPGTPIPQRAERLVVLPSSTLFAWPLWIAAEGESLELVRMELAGRHLLKRGMDESLAILPILRREERQLFLAVACEEPFPGESLPEGWESATRFERPARLRQESRESDLILWEEWGGLTISFYRAGEPVWFCGIREEELASLIHRIALRLLAEGVLDHLPETISLQGIEAPRAEKFAAELSRTFPRARLHQLPLDSDTEAPPPYLREDAFDLPPREARDKRLQLKKRERVLTFATTAALLYLLLLIWGAGDLFIRQNALKKLRHQIALVSPAALAAQGESDRWHQFRSCMDPGTYALDLLAAVAAPTGQGKVRLTLFSLEQGRLQISGEATDVTEAYNFIEQLKKNPQLQEYDWTAGQPQLAGKNSVKFDISGTRPDATHETAGTE